MDILRRGCTLEDCYCLEEYQAVSGYFLFVEIVGLVVDPT